MRLTQAYPHIEAASRRFYSASITPVWRLIVFAFLLVIAGSAYSDGRQHAKTDALTASVRSDKPYVLAVRWGRSPQAPADTTPEDIVSTHAFRKHSKSIRVAVGAPDTQSVEIDGARLAFSITKSDQPGRFVVHLEQTLHRAAGATHLNTTIALDRDRWVLLGGTGHTAHAAGAADKSLRYLFVKIAGHEMAD